MMDFEKNIILFNKWVLKNFPRIGEEILEVLNVDYYITNEVGEKYLERFNEEYFLTMIFSKISNELQYIEFNLSNSPYLILKYNKEVYSKEEKILKDFYFKFSIFNKKIQLYLISKDFNFEMGAFVEDFLNFYKKYLKFLLDNELEIISNLEKEIQNSRKDEKNNSFESSVFN